MSFSASLHSDSPWLFFNVQLMYFFLVSECYLNLKSLISYHKRSASVTLQPGIVLIYSGVVLVFPISVSLHFKYLLSLSLSIFVPVIIGLGI